MLGLSKTIIAFQLRCFQHFQLKLKKFPVYWSSEIPISYKQTLLAANYIKPEKIVTDFDKELRRMKTKFLLAGYPVKFINDTFSRFNEEKE